MPASLDCVLCLTRQSLEAARFAVDDPVVHERVLRKVLALVQEEGFTKIPPLVAQNIQRIVRSETGNADPYSVPKRRFNELMLGFRDALRKRIRTSSQPLETAVRLAIAGNTIDFALRADLDERMIHEAIEASLRQPINGSIEEFIAAVSSAKSILYLLDNCGEIVCDQLLMEEILRLENPPKIVAVVRGAAVINDATRMDAEQIGLSETVPVIDNGNDGVGTILEQCGAEFMERFRASDLLISKGLANFETLVEYGEESLWQRVCYLFKAKCAFISRYAGVELGDLVVRQKFGSSPVPPVAETGEIV